MLAQGTVPHSLKPASYPRWLAPLDII